MSASRTLALYGAGLAAVLAASVAVGAAAEPIGLSNAAPEEAAHGGGMAEGMVPGLAVAEGDLRLVPSTGAVPAGEEVGYAFRIAGDGGTVVDFEIEHTKPMHVIVVRRDLVGFQHLHPEMGPDGTWSTPLRIPEAGAYRVFADFVVDGEKQTLGADLFVAGDFRPQTLPAPAPVADAGDGYTVELAGEPVVGEESELELVVRHHGQVVADLDEYLGALGHLVALRAGDLGYLHVHADAERLHFEVEFPSAGDYRLFLQFRHAGEVRTAAFTVHAEEAPR